MAVAAEQVDGHPPLTMMVLVVLVEVVMVVDIQENPVQMLELMEPIT